MHAGGKSAAEASMRKKLLVLLVLGIANIYAQSGRCNKCCGRLDIVGYGHRNLEGVGPNGCHVTDCDYYQITPDGVCCWQALDSYVDVAGDEEGTSCKNPDYHFCYF